MAPESVDVFLARSSSGNFDRTVTSTVDLGDYPDHPSALGDGEVRLWGASDGTSTRSNFEKLEAGDLVLFCDGDECIGTGRVGAKVEDADGWVGENLLDEDLPLVYTIESFKPVSVPLAAVNRLFGYSASYSPQELMRVADDRLPGSSAAIARAVEKYSQKHAA